MGSGEDGGDEDVMSGSPRPVVAFLGPLGTYSHQAVMHRFGASVKLLPRPTIRTVVESMLAPSSLSARPTYALVPLRNSTAGPVAETAAALDEPDARRRLATDDTLELGIRHCLLARRVADRKVLNVVSHEQALAQCKHTINRLYPGITPTAVASTALAAQVASDDVSGSTVAVSSAFCASVFPELEILRQSVQDAGEDNRTTFVILTRRGEEQEEQQAALQ